MYYKNMIYLILYFIGIPVWMTIEKKYFPYQEGDYTIEFDGAHEITPDIYKTNVVARSVLWPLCVAILIIAIPLVLLDKLFDTI